MHRVLGVVSWLDCLIFVIFLAPQLLIDPHAGLVKVLFWLIAAIPYFVFELPYTFIRDHFILPYEKRPEIVKNSTLFQELVLRLVRYAFSNLPSEMGRVFFKKEIALPFYRFRLLRHGLWPNNVPSWKPEELNINGVRGIWFKTFKDRKPDIVLYYIHGGGFTMGSSYFYLEFLASLASKLKDTGFKNPSVFAIDYTLVPDSKFPTQLNEAYKGYQILHELAGEAELVICGDSAGGNLALALLLYLARPPNGYEIDRSLRKPSYATLISPWTVLVSPNNDNTKGDFLDAPQLHNYGISYANSGDISDPYKSPGLCEDLKWWEEALPVNGVHVVYGNMEVFSAGIRNLISMIEEMKTLKLKVTERTTVHAWPVVQLFLGASMREREEGLDIIAGAISEALLLRKTTDAPN